MRSGRLKVIVTGAAGLIGHEVVARLVAQGHDVIGLYRSPASAEAQNSATAAVIDLAAEGLGGRFRNEDVDVVVHCAAIFPASHGEQGQDAIALTNRKIDDAVISFCRERGCRLVYMSSTAVYGSGRGRLDEEASTMPEGAYAREKLMSEKQILAASVSAVILRINAPYGHRQRSQTVLKTFIERASEGKDIYYYGSGSRTQDFTACADVADAVCKAIDHPEVQGIFNIAGGAPVSMKALAELVVELIPQSSSRVLPAGKDDPQEGFRASYSIARAGKELLWHPRITLAEGIRAWASHMEQERGRR